MTPKEIKMEDFIENRYLIYYRFIEARAKRQANPVHFFKEWRKWMELDIAKTFEVPGGLLGMIFTPDIFTGDFDAQIVFWWALPDCKDGLKLMEAAIEQAKARRCRRLQSAAFEQFRGEAMGRLYRRMGFVQTETIFQKELS
jgi:GNAT superfamily N-acetyltransferase